MTIKKKLLPIKKKLLPIKKKLLPYCYVLVVTCVVVRRGQKGIEALILKRNEKEKEGPGLWTIPGGKVERKKDWGKPKMGLSFPTFQGLLERAIRREVKEETGLPIDKFFFSPGAEAVFLRNKGKGPPTLTLRFWAFCGDGDKVKLCKESTAYAWVLSRDVDRYAFIGNVKSAIVEAIDEATFESVPV